MRSNNNDKLPRYSTTVSTLLKPRFAFEYALMLRILAVLINGLHTLHENLGRTVKERVLSSSNIWSVHCGTGRRPSVTFDALHAREDRKLVIFWSFYRGALCRLSLPLDA